MSDCDILILGAGPYGLSAAAHLRAVKGLDVRVFGEPMSFWERYMPEGMLLRSGWQASHISDPALALTLDAYKSAVASDFAAPVPLERFVQYGHWYQQQVVPDLDRRKVAGVDRNARGFKVTTEDGEILHARRVVVATGIAPFAWRPPEFANLPREMASHSADHRSFRNFKDRRVAVVGGGQSALESAALLGEAGAQVEVLVRESHVHWLGFQKKVRRLGPVHKALYAPTDVGPAGISQLVARPNYFRQLPRPLQDRIARRCIRPAGAVWLRDRLRDVSITIERSVRSAEVRDGELRLLLNDGTERRADHLVAATGYRVDLTNYAFLSPALLAQIKCVDGYPVLDHGLQSSVTGLHFLGAPAAWSFGPLLRFVSGTAYAAQALRRSVEARRAAAMAG